MRLIDADALKERYAKYFRGWLREYIYIRDEVLRKLDDMPTVPQWISVEDRLPEINADGTSDTVAALTSWRTVFAGFWDGVVWRDANDANMCWYEGAVTHWMPLPSTEGINETDIV